ncbi:hypothetical protein ACLKA7_005296 [Drosophila subpalustris]
MAATFVFVLSCLVYGVVAGPPSSSYLPPGVAVGGRPSVQGSVAPAVIARPSSSYLPPTKRVAAGRLASPTSGPAVSKPTVQRPIASGTASNTISSSGVGAARPITSGPQQSSYKAGAPVAFGPRTVGSHAPY